MRAILGVKGVRMSSGSRGFGWADGESELRLKERILAVQRWVQSSWRVSHDLHWVTDDPWSRSAAAAPAAPGSCSSAQPSGLIHHRYQQPFENSGKRSA